MTFSGEWEEVYQKGAQNSLWPWSDLVTYVMRYARLDRKPYRVLELGFGAGANIPFLLSFGAEYFGTEGSATAVGRIQERITDPRLHVACCDFTYEIPFTGPFDLVVDRSSLTHNGTRAIRNCISAIGELLVPEGRFIGIDWFSTEHSDFIQGVPTEDFYTRSGFTEGQFSGVGTVHFSDEQHLRDLFGRFEFLKLEKKLILDVTSGKRGKIFSSFNLACRKA